jgi:hypothetical protein
LSSLSLPLLPPPLTPSDDCLAFLRFLHPAPPSGDEDACAISFWKKNEKGAVNIELGGIRTDQLAADWPKIEPYLVADLYFTANGVCWFPRTNIRRNQQTGLIPWKRNCRTVRWLMTFFVDLDWHDGSVPPRAERRAIFEGKRLACGMPPASVIVYTPRGLQAFWRIEPMRSHPYAQRKWQTAQAVLIEKGKRLTNTPV